MISFIFGKIWSGINKDEKFLELREDPAAILSLKSLIAPHIEDTARPRAAETSRPAENVECGSTIFCSLHVPESGLKVSHSNKGL